jgi:oligoendopeptidase F
MDDTEKFVDPHWMAQAPEEHRGRLEIFAIEWQIQNIFQQTSGFEFQERLYAQAQDSILTPDFVKNTHLDTYRQVFGPGYGQSHPMDALDWAEKSYHFTQPPFGGLRYVYAQVVANALLRDFETRGSDFAKDYIKMMEAGASVPPRELLETFGIDTEDPAFWAGEIGHLKEKVQALTEKYAGPAGVIKKRNNKPLKNLEL